MLPYAVLKQCSSTRESFKTNLISSERLGCEMFNAGLAYPLSLSQDMQLYLRQSALALYADI